jgi:outer membrane protein OmpA-like peptidoglycan-associated protein
MPVKLGFAVLRDRAGQIVLDVPVEGSLDDPDFSFGRVIVRALLNILRNIVTAPFKLLGSLFGGGSADLSEAPFDAGASALTAEAKSRLDALRKSLVERPDLKLSIEGAVDSVADREALRKLALDRRLRLQAPALADTALLLPSARSARLANEFATLFPTDSTVLAARARSRPLAEALAGRDIEARVLAGLPIGTAELQALAEARARACRDYLANGEGAPVDRVFLAASGAAPVAAGRKATFKLE